MNISKSVYVVSASLGACIGALVSLEINSRFNGLVPFVWVIGALLGGLVSYIAIDIKGFMHGVLTILRNMISWRPYLLYWKALTITTLSFTMIISYMCMLCVLFKWIVPPSLSATVTLIVCILFVGFMLSLMGVHEKYSPRHQLNTTNDFALEEISDSSWGILKKFNPLALVWYGLKLVYYVLLGVLLVIENSPEIVYWTLVALAATFIFVVNITIIFPYKVFLFTHSSRRMACMLDAGVGSIIGYYFGSATLGACAGGALGLISYEVTYRVRTKEATPEVA